MDRILTIAELNKQLKKGLEQVDQDKTVDDREAAAKIRARIQKALPAIQNLPK